LTVGQGLGFGEPRILALFVVAIVLLLAFVLIERRTPQPMIDLRLFQNSLFSVNLVSGFLTFVSMGGTIILIPFFLENVLGYSIREVGLLMATAPLAIGVVAPLSGALSDRFGSRPITVIGLLSMLLGFYLMTGLSAETTTLGYVVRFLPVGIGMGIFQSPNNSAVMGAVPRRRLGVASGLLAETRTLGQTTGIAVLGAIWAARVSFHYGAALPGGATTAPASAQVAGILDTFAVVMGLIGFGLALSVWAVVKERRQRIAALRAQL
jgi:MFS family permease